MGLPPSFYGAKGKIPRQHPPADGKYNDVSSRAHQAFCHDAKCSATADEHRSQALLLGLAWQLLLSGVLALEQDSSRGLLLSIAQILGQPGKRPVVRLWQVPVQHIRNLLHSTIRMSALIYLNPTATLRSSGLLNSHPDEADSHGCLTLPRQIQMTIMSMMQLNIISG